MDGRRKDSVWVGDVRFARPLAVVGFAGFGWLAVLAGMFAFLEWGGLHSVVVQYGKWPLLSVFAVVPIATFLATFAIKVSAYARAAPLLTCIVAGMGQAFHVDGRLWLVVPVLSAVYVVPGLVLGTRQAYLACVVWIAANLIDFFWTPARACDNCGPSIHGFFSLAGFPIYAVVTGLLAVATLRRIRGRDAVAQRRL